MGHYNLQAFKLSSTFKMCWGVPSIPLTPMTQTLPPLPFRPPHWRQRRRGCRGHIPSNILVGWDVNGNIPPILLHTFGHSSPILVALRLRSSRFPSAIRCRQFASVRQADSGLTYCRLYQCIDECKKPVGEWLIPAGLLALTVRQWHALSGGMSLSSRQVH